MNQEIKERDERMEWWRKARFGMFIHWGLYSQLGRHEWVMNRERIPVSEYEKLADTWKPKPRASRMWAKIAKQAGMKYIVMTTKHHEGFCLWDTKQTDYNAVKRSPGRDLVKEFVEACREFGLKIGFYYSLMDWHHPDGGNCLYDENARKRFINFTHNCVRELCSNYGKIDILWYDVAYPLKTPELWESKKMNEMVRKLQPHIIINNRSLLPEDFDTPEQHVTPTGRDWESCMTFNESWGYMPSSIDWKSPRQILGMLTTAAAHGGNFLLNVGPAPDGSFPEEATSRLKIIGKWLEKHGEAIYGKVDRIDGKFEWMPQGYWTLKGNHAYFHCKNWVGSELVIGGLQTEVKRIFCITTGKDVKFYQEKDRLIMKGLPSSNPDKIAGITVFRLEFDQQPLQKLGAYIKILE